MSCEGLIERLQKPEIFMMEQLSLVNVSLVFDDIYYFFSVRLPLVLHSIYQQIWKTQQWPQDWKRSVFIPIPKKGNVKECSTTTTKSLQSCPTLRPLRRQPTRLLHPWDSPGKSTGVGCHCLLLRMLKLPHSCTHLTC